MLALAVVLWLALSVLPGLAVLRLARVPGSFVSSAVMAAPVSFGVVYLVGLVATRAGASTETLCFALIAALLALWLVDEVLRLRRGGGAAMVTTAFSDWRAGWRRPELAIGRAAGVLAVVIGVVLWVVVQSRLVVPAGWDAMHHAYFIRQIMDHQTLSEKVVLASDPSGTDGFGFYPLAANLAAALISNVSGAHVSTVLLGSTIALSGVLLPAGVYLLVRRVAPDLPMLAGLAAIASVLPARLYTVGFTGRITVTLGMALVPASATLLLLWARRSDRRWLAVVPLAAIGVFGVHSSELVIAFVIGVPITVARHLHAGDRRGLAKWLVSVLAAGAITGLVLYVLDSSFVTAVNQRTGSLGPAGGMRLPFVSAVHQTVVLSAPSPAHNSGPMATFSILALIGCALTMHPRLRALRAVAVGYLLWALFYFLWLWGHIGPMVPLANLWYRNTQRMLWEFTVIGAVPVGISLLGAAAVIHSSAIWLRQRSPAVVERRRSFSPLGAVVAAIAVIALVFVMAPPAKTDAQWLRTYASPVSRDSQRAFVYLAAHLGPHERVMDDLEGHGDLWMFADYGVPTLFGSPPPIGDAGDSWKERLYLRARLGRIGSDSCVGLLLHDFNVQYIYYSDDKMWGGRTKFSLRTLRNTHFFRQVFQSGGARVFQVVPHDVDPSACGSNVTTQYPWSTLANSN